MATRTIRTIGDDVLTKVCKEVKEVTPKTKDFYMGRTLDYEFSYGEQITITPRNRL